MNCEQIEKALNMLKVDSLGRIRNKSKVIDAIHAMHLGSVDSDFMDVRVEIAKLGTSNDLKSVDLILYRKQISI